MVTLSFVGLIIFFFLLDYLFIRDMEKPIQPHHGHGDEPEPDDAVVMPKGYFFHPGHSWVRRDGAGEVTVGVDDVVQAALSRISGVELPAQGASLKAGATAFKLTVGGRSLEFVSPVTGTVTRVNTTLERGPGAINVDPYGAGWLFAVKVQSDNLPLPSNETAVEWMTSELGRLGEFVAKYRKGTSYKGTLLGANNQVWAMFQEGFLSLQAQKEA